MYGFPGATFLIALRDWEMTGKFIVLETCWGKRHATLIKMEHFPPQGLLWWVYGKIPDIYSFPDLDSFIIVPLDSKCHLSSICLVHRMDAESEKTTKATCCFIRNATAAS